MIDRFSELSGAEIAELRAETEKDVKTLSQLTEEIEKKKGNNDLSENC